MVRNLFYGIFGALLGLVMSLVWAALPGQISLVQVINWPSGQLVGWVGLWILGGLVAGVVAADPWPADLVTRQKAARLSRQQLVSTIPARCGRCRGTGRTFYFFRCGVCGGQGHVLVAQPKKKCAWCRGTGRRFLFRCRACGGSGWLHP